MRVQLQLLLSSNIAMYYKSSPGAGENALRLLALFSYQDHPPKYVVTSGLNCAEQLVSQSEKMAFRLAKIFLYFEIFETIKFVSFHTEDRKMLHEHFFRLSEQNIRQKRKL